MMYFYSKHFFSLSNVQDYAPFFEIDPHWESEDSFELIESIRANHAKLGRRVFNTHLRWNMLSKNEARPDRSRKQGKFIYLIRSPMDVCVSFYYHLSHQEEGGYEGSFDDFFQEWTAGQVAFGSWADHIRSFLPAAATTIDGDDGRQQRVLFLFYDDMLTDLSSAVRSIAEFIEMDVTHDDINGLLPTFTFDAMKANLNRFQPRSVTWKNNFKFLRKGIAGDDSMDDVASNPQRQKSLLQEATKPLVDELKEMVLDNIDEKQKQAAEKILKLLVTE